VVVGHLAFNDPRIRAEPALWEKLEEQLLFRLGMGGVEHLRGKNPDETPSCDVPSGGCG
jgi:hypothetical protein